MLDALLAEGVAFPRDWSEEDKLLFLRRYIEEMDLIMAFIERNYATTDMFDPSPHRRAIALEARTTFLFLSDIHFAMYLTFEQRKVVMDIIEEGGNAFNIETYLASIGIDRDRQRSVRGAPSLAVQIEWTHNSAEMGISYQDWYGFMYALSFIDGPAKFAASHNMLYQLQKQWQEARMNPQQTVVNPAAPPRSNVAGSPPRPGSLNNVQTRQWYNNELRKISSRIDRTQPLEQQARQASEMRNQIRTQARDAMSDRAEANRLFGTKPNMTWEQTVARYKSRGFSGDALWHEIIEASQRSNPAVNSGLGITP